MTDTPYRAAPATPEPKSTSDFAGAYLGSADPPSDSEKFAGLDNAARLVREGAENKSIRDVATFDTADHGKVLRFLMPDGWDNLHVQVQR